MSSVQAAVSAAEKTIAAPTGGISLLIIDQQVDFHPGGSLGIPTANEDAKNITAFIQKHSKSISQIVMTLDSHHRYHIAHGIFWTNDRGESPQPFTLITSKDISNGIWKPRNMELMNYVVEYTKALEAGGKFTLCIWPEHCLIGTKGHNIVENVMEAALAWSKETLTPIKFVLKGTNPLTEHYSALRAEFELPDDPATSLNKELILYMKHASKVVVCGEAISHCVNYTMRDLVNAWPADRIKDLYLLTDSSSPVPGFEGAATTFTQDMTAKGVTLVKSSDFSL